MVDSDTPSYYHHEQLMVDCAYKQVGGVSPALLPCSEQAAWVVQLYRHVIQMWARTLS